MKAFFYRTLGLHTILFIVVFLAFVLPVLFGTSAVLPVWLSGTVGIAAALALLGDAAHHLFAAAEKGNRTLRLLGIAAAFAHAVGWAFWLYIYGNFDSAGTFAYRMGTFLLSVGAVLNLFCLALAFLDLRAAGPSASPRARAQRGT